MDGDGVIVVMMMVVMAVVRVAVLKEKKVGTKKISYQILERQEETLRNNISFHL